MTAVYALVLVAGILLAIPFVIESSRHLPRPVVGAMLGFGLAGMSASFAGWHDLLALLAALAGAGAIATGARYLAPRDAAGSDE